MTDRTQLQKHQRYIGVFWYESDSQMYKGRPDKCYYIMYREPVSKKLIKTKVGWASEGFTPEIAQTRRTEAIENKRTAVETPPELDPITLDELSAQYLEWATANKKDHGYNDEIRYRLHLKPKLGQKIITEITLKDLEDLRTKLTKKLSAQSIDHIFKLLKAMLNKATDWNLFTGKNPVESLKSKPLNNARVRYLTRDEARSLLVALAPHSNTRDMALLSLGSGLRFGEVAHLQWQDLNFDTELAHVRDAKSGYDRFAQIKGPVKQMLLDRRERFSRVSGYIFTNTKTEPYAEVPRVYDKAVEAIGVNATSTDAKDRVVFHTLRHTFASWLAIQGTPLYTIQRLMGHKSIKITERYAHLCPDVQAAAVETMLSGLGW
ncbi:site-specific integrase [Myxococcota bacterium]|nr:site-specific integrase [Myxococcota bacterium]